MRSNLHLVAFATLAYAARMAVIVHTGELDHADVQALLALHVAAMHMHSPPEACHVLPAAALGHSSITFFTARENGALLGMGALKELGGAAGEIKSMRTAPGAARKGVGRTILHAIVAEARRRAYRHLLLETGRSDDFAAALALYLGEGFTECGPFGGYQSSPFTRFMALTLDR